ncbi:DUF1877 family protein [Streptomyces flaveus]|uniref:DUF1877 family protein n=1 Tax=Streptomyces flaveus TaxID=66370 RepID=UPI00332495D4
MPVRIDIFEPCDRLSAAQTRQQRCPLPHTKPDQQPPFVILNPDQVATVADLLVGASFEALWQVEGAKLTAPYAQWENPEGAAKENYLAHHTGLREFYGRAATAHRAVVKAFWY